MTLVSDSPAATRRMAARLGALVERGDVVALVGDLGAGKTAFVKGLAEGLGIVEPVPSPTFNIVLDHAGGRLPLHHIDLYRIVDGDELAHLGLETYLYGDGVCAVEWMDRFPSLAPADRLEIELRLAAPKRRELTVTAHGPRSTVLADEWLGSVDARGRARR